MIGPLGFAEKNLGRRGFHSFLAFAGLTLSVASTTFLLLLGQGLTIRLGAILSPEGTFGIDWLFFGYLTTSLILILIVGAVSTSYLVSSMVNQRVRDLAVIRAAGALPRRLLWYAMAESMVVVLASCLAGALLALLLYVAWSWPTTDLLTRVGPVPEAGATVFFVVPIASFLLSYLAARHQVGKILKLGALSAITSQLSGLDLKSLGKPLKVGRLGSAFNLATRNVSRDQDFGRTFVRVSVCIFLSILVLTGALVSADTSRDYVQRAMPTNALIVASSPMYDQYVKLGTAFSSTTPIPSFNYTDQSYLIGGSLVSSFRNIAGVEKVDARLVTVSAVGGFIKAHLVSNETGGNFNNVYVPEVYLGSAQALIVGVDPSNVVGNWFTSDGFLGANDTQDTIVAGDSLVGGIVQMPFSLAQVGALGTRYDVKGAVVDPLNQGRVLYAPVQSVQSALRVSGYNLLLIQTDNSPSAVAAVESFATSNGLVAESMGRLVNADLDFLNNTWSYFFILPVMTLILTCGTLLSYLTTNFSRRFNDYLVLRILGAKAWFSLRLLLWEGWGLLAISMVIAIPLAWLVSIFFLLPEATIATSDQIFAVIIPVVALGAVSLSSAVIYSRRLQQTTVKDLRG
ncbi:MAG TPA: FtsX-like permease family protein [Candidatus Dormibacteraeota bacterium]|nr:FtsX-like permease family protein [Candidatus Dormibacteraeota bacterium]